MEMKTYLFVIVNVCFTAQMLLNNDVNMPGSAGASGKSSSELRVRRCNHKPLNAQLWIIDKNTQREIQMKAAAWVAMTQQDCCTITLPNKYKHIRMLVGLERTRPEPNQQQTKE